MRCITCGLPLSPLRNDKRCPRCGTIIASNSHSAQQNDPPARVATVAQELGDPKGRSSISTTPPGFPTLLHTPQQELYPQQTQVPLNTNANQQFPKVRTRLKKRNSIHSGLLAAGLCVLMGGLILVFVFFMEQGLQSSSLPSIPSQHTPTQSGPAPVVTNPTPSPAVEVSPTATLFPAQRYIDSAQMASSVSPTSAQATSLATAFHINTKIYVTFHIHSGGQAGAACILWYLNGTKILNYSFAIAANAGASYSYAFYRGTGAGYVAIYWASSTQCTDQLLAQEVNFTVTP